MDKQAQERLIRCSEAIGKTLYLNKLRHNIKIHFFKISYRTKIMLVLSREPSIAYSKK
jgi:hypothetical protein